MDRKVAKADAKYQKLHSQKRKKDSSDRKVGNEIFDKLTLETLYKLANQGHIDILNGAISTGKEANVLTGITDDERFVAVKIYRIATSDFKKMDYYLKGDPRFNIKTKNKRKKDSSERKVGNEIFDKITLETLYKLANQGYIDILNGAISTGKEANVLTGITDDEEFVAVKIYRIATSDFKKMDYYLKGDPRFNVKTKNKRKIIYSWVTKEFKNLTRLYDAGVNVPKPFTSSNNVLIIEFIGDKNGNPAQPVRNQPPENPDEFFNKLLVQLKLFVREAKLVHGDLSNYNILNLNEEPVIIDVSQSVVLDNPISKELLERDINTLVREYTKLGVETSFKEIWEYIDPKF